MPKVTLNCSQCNRPFDVWPYRLMSNVRFCSRNCKNIASLGRTPVNRVKLVGRTFGELVVIAFEGTAGGHTIWRCKCRCGNETIVRNGNLQSGSVRSCGCLTRRTGEQSPNWQNGFTISTHGYTPLLTAKAQPEQKDLVVKDEKRSREIPIRVYLPTGQATAPVVVFSHGLGGNREGSAFLGKHWAARGYVAVFLQHPGSDDCVWKDKSLAQRRALLKQAATLENLLFS